MSRLIETLDNRPEQRIIMSYAPSGNIQKDFFNSWNICNIIRGPVGSAKTTALVFKIWDAICDQPMSPDGVRRSRIAICRNTNPDLKRTILKEWLELIPEECGVYNISDKEHTLKFTIHEDGSKVESTVYFMALDTPKSIKSLLSMQLTFVVYNEIREHRRETIFRSLQRTARYPSQKSMPRVPQGDPKYLRYWCPKKHEWWLSQPNRDQIQYPNPTYWSGMLADSNAWDRDHFLEHIRRMDSPKWSFHDQPAGVEKIDGEWRVNPKAENMENLSPDYYPNAMDGASESEIKVQLGNQMTVLVDGEPVHPDFDHQHHVCSTAGYIKGKQVYAGFDFARRPAVVLMQAHKGGFQCFGEFPMFNVGLRRYFTELTTFLAMEYGLHPSDLCSVGDESSNARNESDESAIMIASQCGYSIPKPNVGNKDHKGRRDTIDRHLKRMRDDGRPAFLVHPDCSYLVGALEGKWFYRKMYNRIEDTFSIEPWKNDHSHTGDACEYGMSQFGVGFIESVPHVWRQPLPAYS